MYPELSKHMTTFTDYTRALLTDKLARRFAPAPAKVATPAPPPRREPPPVVKPASTESRHDAQQTDDQLAEAIKSADAQRGAIALIELRAIDAKLVQREAKTNEEQDRLWILLARAYTRHHAVTWAEVALRRVRSAGLEATAQLRRKLGKLRAAHLRGKKLAPEAESAYIHKRLGKR